MKYRRYRSDKPNSPAAAETVIRGRKVPKGYVLEITHFAVFDETESGNIVSIGYYTTTDVYVKLESIHFDEHFGISLRGTAWLEAGEQPACNIATPGAGDAVFFSCHGKLWPEKLWKVEDAEVRETDNVSHDS